MPRSGNLQALKTPTPPAGARDRSRPRGLSASLGLRQRWQRIDSAHGQRAIPVGRAPRRETARRGMRSLPQRAPGPGPAPPPASGAARPFTVLEASLLALEQAGGQRVRLHAGPIRTIVTRRIHMQPDRRAHLRQ